MPGHLTRAWKAAQLAAINYPQQLLRRDGRTLRKRRRIDSTHEQWVVVLTYARTGSTLLMGLLNTLPGYCIRGENDGGVVALQTFHEVMTQRSAEFTRTPSGPTHPYWGIDNYPSDMSLEQMRTLLLSVWIRPPAGVSHVGYKELRWPANGLAQHIAFLRELMPGVKVILNHRNVADVSKSAWYKDNPADEWIQSRADEVEAVAESDNDVYLVRYEEICEGPEAFMRLAQWLGSPADEKAVRKTLDTRHSVR